MRSYRDAALQRCGATAMQSYRDAELERCGATDMQSYSDADSMHLKTWWSTNADRGVVAISGCDGSFARFRRTTQHQQQHS